MPGRQVSWLYPVPQQLDALRMVVAQGVIPGVPPPAFVPEEPLLDLLNPMSELQLEALDARQLELRDELEWAQAYSLEARSARVSLQVREPGPLVSGPPCLQAEPQPVGPQRELA